MFSVWKSFATPRKIPNNTSTSYVFYIFRNALVTFTIHMHFSQRSQKCPLFCPRCTTKKKNAHEDIIKPIRDYIKFSWNHTYSFFRRFSFRSPNRFPTSVFYTINGSRLMRSLTHFLLSNVFFSVTCLF